MSTLLGANIGTNYKGILNLDATTINTPLDATLRAVTDGMGNSSVLKLSTAQVAFGAFTGATTGDIVWRANGTLTEYTGWHQSDGEYKLITKNASPIFINIANGLNFANGFSTQGGFNSSGFYVGTSPTQNGQLTVKGSGSNILSLRDSSNVEVVAIDNLGGITSNWAIIAGSGQGFRISGKIFLKSSADGIATITNSGEDNFSRFNLGGTTSSFPAIKRNGAAIDFRLADDSGYAAVTTGILTTTGAAIISVARMNFINDPTNTVSAISFANTTGKTTFGAALRATALPTTRPATVGDLYAATAADILANGDLVIGIRV